MVHCLYLVPCHLDLVVKCYIRLLATTAAPIASAAASWSVSRPFLVHLESSFKHSTTYLSGFHDFTYLYLEVKL